uniref:Uncharacterized protein n=1 Tax=Oryza punctata TaxID=4537 RepID=A0A0E0K7N3_ORYPU
MEAAGSGKEATKRMRTAMMDACRATEERERRRWRWRWRARGAHEGEWRTPPGSTVTITTAPITEDDMAITEEEEVAASASAETEEHVQRILLAIDAFTRQVSEMLEAGRALFKNLAADFEHRLCSIHKERVERWEEEMRELRARDNSINVAAALSVSKMVIHYLPCPVE